MLSGMSTEHVALESVKLRAARPPGIWKAGVACLLCAKAVFPDAPEDFDRDVPPFLEEHAPHHHHGRCTLVARDPETGDIVAYAQCGLPQ